MRVFQSWSTIMAQLWINKILLGWMMFTKPRWKGAQHHKTLLLLSDWGDNSVIHWITTQHDERFASLDELVNEMTETMPMMLSTFLWFNFWLANFQLDCLTFLDFTTIESYIVYGALDIRDMIATVSMQHIQHIDLALALFVARVCGAVFYNQAQV